MKKICLLLVFVMVLGMAVTASAVKPVTEPIVVEPEDEIKLSGPHYNLNIIGVPKDKTADMNNSKGHVIFVDLDGKSRINLVEGDCFCVLDKNGTDTVYVNEEWDSKGASFQLPNPDAENDGITEYSVFARALGKPGGSTTMTAGCFDELGNEYFSLEQLVIESHKKQTFQNVSKELLYVYYDFDGDGRVERVNLFNERYRGYFWEYDNNGLKLLQLRFYPHISTDVGDADPFEE